MLIAGANVAVTDQILKLLKVAAEASEKYGVIAKPYKLDISVEDEVKTVFAEVNSELSKIDILVAGAAHTGEGINYYETPWI